MSATVDPTVGAPVGVAVTGALLALENYPEKPKEWKPGYWAKCQNYGTEFGGEAGCSGWKKADALQCKKCLDLLKVQAGYAPVPSSKNGNGNGAHKSAPAVISKNGRKGKSKEELGKLFETAAKAFVNVYEDVVNRMALEDEKVAEGAAARMLDLEATYVKLFGQGDLEGATAILWQGVNEGNVVQLVERLAKIDGLEADPSDERMVQALGNALSASLKIDHRIKAADAFLRMRGAVIARKERELSRQREAKDILANIAGVRFRPDGRTKTGVRWLTEETVRRPAAYEPEDDLVPENNAADATLAAMKAGTLTSAPATKPLTKQQLAAQLAELGIEEEVGPVKQKQAQKPPRKPGRRVHRRNGNSPEED